LRRTRRCDCTWRELRHRETSYKRRGYESRDRNFPRNHGT
jgi:hypothetical protein